MSSSATLTVERLREVLNYDPETGVFIRLVSNNRRHKVGEEAGYLDDKGYVRVGFAGREYRAHRLAWFYMTGKWPAEVDHKNGFKTDNRWTNLREGTHAQNHQNIRRARATNPTGELGVSQRPGRKPCARITIDGRQYTIGHFDSRAEASEAYWMVKAAFHPFAPEARS